MNIDARYQFMIAARKVQSDWAMMVSSGHITKKKMCAVCVPFRDAYALTDAEALHVARNEYSLSELMTIAEKNNCLSEPAYSVDAVPVVRCRDCKRYDNGCCSKLLERYCEDCESSFDECVDPDGFCSYGERKEDSTLTDND